MKRLSLVIAALVVAACGSEKPAESDFTITVTGTPGIGFQGSYLVILANGSSTSKSVQGKTPMEIQAHGAMVSTAFQKATAKGLLSVVVQRNGNVVTSADTEAAYGVATAATH